MNDRKTTRTLERELLETDSREELNAYLKALKETPAHTSFREYFFGLEKVRTKDEAEIRKGSGIERTYYSHIRDGSKHPGRDKVLRLCLSAGLSPDETRRALEAAGLPVLYAKSRRDAVLSFCLQRHLSVIDTDLLLENYHLEPLR